MKRLVGLGLLLTSLAINTAGADVMTLTGEGAGTGAPLSADVDFDVTSPTSLRVTVTHTADKGGGDARLTYFGLQLQNENIDVQIDPSTFGSWKILQDSKLPGGGADTFNWLFKSDGNGATGLDLGQTLVINFISSLPLFSNFDLGTWTPTTKNHLLAEVKYQSVGPFAEDSGEAFNTGTTLTQRSSPSSAAPVVPEPATLALLAGGLLLMLPRRGSVRESVEAAQKRSGPYSALSIPAESPTATPA